jgi:hypothetical protein
MCEIGSVEPGADDIVIADPLGGAVGGRCDGGDVVQEIVLAEEDTN